MGRPQRNGNFRFRSNELLIIDPSTCTFNPTLNVVVENMRGQRGDIRRDLLSPLNLRPPVSDRPGKSSINTWKVCS